MKRRTGAAYLDKWVVTASIPTDVANQVSSESQESALKKEMSLWDKTGVWISPFSMKTTFFRVDMLKIWVGEKKWGILHW